MDFAANLSCESTQPNYFLLSYDKDFIDCLEASFNSKQKALGDQLTTSDFINLLKPTTELAAYFGEVMVLG